MEENKKKVGAAEAIGGAIAGTAAGVIGIRQSLYHHIGKLGFDSYTEFDKARAAVEHIEQNYIPDTVDATGKTSEYAKKVQFKEQAAQAMRDFRGDRLMIAGAAIAAAVVVGAGIYLLKPEPEQEPEPNLDSKAQHFGKVQEQDKKIEL